MKVLLATGLALCCVQAALVGQSKAPNQYTYNALSAKVLGIDYGTPNEIDDLSTSFGFELAYRRQLGKQFGLALPLKLGVIDVGELENINFASLDVLGHFYPSGSETQIAPYLLAGIGVVAEADDANHQIPIGAGLNVKLGENSFVGAQGEYRLSNQDFRDNIQFGIGYTYRFSGADTDQDGIVNRIDACPELPGPKATNGCPDKDGDGVLDEIDKCPTIAGDANLFGCPDQDGDGLADPNDDCPTAAGPADLNGCPDLDKDGVIDDLDRCPGVPGNPDYQGCPDSDNDGIIDREDDCPNEYATTPNGCPPADTDKDGVLDKDDRCPEVAGKVELSGCPDTDNDGVADADDRCPNEAGSTSNKGCPEIEEEVVQLLEFATQAVQFETGSARLLPESNFTLDEIVRIMQKYPAYSLVISGHTDNTGEVERNQELSENRAKACHDYLQQAGIDPNRMTYLGYGQLLPRADNGTVAGRKLNRRVEFELRLLKKK